MKLSIFGNSLKLFVLAAVLAKGSSDNLRVNKSTQDGGTDNTVAKTPQHDRNLKDIPEGLYDCPPIPKSVWWCWWCNPDTSDLDSYNEIMGLYDDDEESDSENSAKAITLMFGKKNGKVGSFTDNQLKQVFASSTSSAHKECVREVFENVVCFTIENSDYFNKGNLSSMKVLKALPTFKKFVIGFATGSVFQVAKATKDLMDDIVIPAMNDLIGGISFMLQIDPDSKFKRDLLLKCSIH
jgi:hypothetical protein